MRHEISPYWPTLQGLGEAFALVSAVIGVGMLLWAVTL